MSMHPGKPTDEEQDAAAEAFYGYPMCGEDHHIGDRPDSCFACLDDRFNAIKEQRDALLEVARIEQALQMRGYTRATAKSLGEEAEQEFLIGGTPGLNNWRRQKREAAIGKTQVG